MPAPGRDFSISDMTSMMTSSEALTLSEAMTMTPEPSQATLTPTPSFELDSPPVPSPRRKRGGPYEWFIFFLFFFSFFSLNEPVVIAVIMIIFNCICQNIFSTHVLYVGFVFYVWITLLIGIVTHRFAYVFYQQKHKTVACWSWHLMKIYQVPRYQISSCCLFIQSDVATTASLRLTHLMLTVPTGCHRFCASELRISAGF